MQTAAITSDVQTITEREFCKRVGISVGTACALRKAGKLAHCRVGRRVLYIFPRHVDEFLTRTERRPDTPNEPSIDSLR